MCGVIGRYLGVMHKYMWWGIGRFVGMMDRYAWMDGCGVIGRSMWRCVGVWGDR